MNAVKSTLGVAAAATTALLAASIVKTPKTPESELSPKEQTELQEQRAQEKEARTYYWNDKQSTAANVIDGAATTTNIAKQEIGKGIDKATDNPAPLTAALVLETLGLAGAGAVEKKKKAQARAQAQAKAKAEAFEQKRIAEETALREQREADIKAYEAKELEEAKKIEDAKKSQLGEISSNLPYHVTFPFDVELRKFGVSFDDLDKPLKKNNRSTSADDWKYAYERCTFDKDNHIVLGNFGGRDARVYAEQFRTKDGNIVEAGVAFPRVSEGVDAKDYTYRYVRLLEPTLEGKVCEVGRVHYVDPDGHVVEYEREVVLNRYDPEDKYQKRNYSVLHKYVAHRSNKKYRYFPEYEQQERKAIKEEFLNSYFCNCEATPEISRSHSLEDMASDGDMMDIPYTRRNYSCEIKK